MKIMDIRDALHKEMAHQMKMTADRLTAGSASDYAGYKSLVGRLAGHRDGIAAVDHVFKKLITDEES